VCPYAPLASLRAPLHHAPRTVVSDPPCTVCASCHVHPPMPHTIHTPRSALPVSRASCHTPPLPRAALPSAHVNLHWAVASRWARVATVCFMHFRCMLHMFHLYFAKVDLVLHMLQWLHTCVASVCFSCFKRMLQVFHLDVAYVAVAIHVCCKCVSKCFSCFI
jgi:hypothetical protein